MKPLDLETVSVDLLTPKGKEPWREFEDNATAQMSAYFGMPLKKVRIRGFPKEFDMVSTGCEIVGDAKWKSLPPNGQQEKVLCEEITTYVWLLEKVMASRKFLIFGNDRRVPEAWLEKYGCLPTSVEFYFWDEKGPVERLTGIKGHETCAEDETVVQLQK
jgi:hypothetical protein